RPVLAARSEEAPESIDLRVELAREFAIAGRAAGEVTEVGLERAGRDREVAPADHPIAPQQRKGVVAADAFGLRRVRLEAVGPAPEPFETWTIPDDRIERRQESDRSAGGGGGRVLAGRPVPPGAVYVGVREPPPRAEERRRDSTTPLRRRVAQPADHHRQA